VAHSQNRSAVTGNSFLDALPEETRARLSGQLTLRPMGKRQVLAAAGAPIKDVFFPIHSMVSTVLHSLEGSAVEVGLAGHEGLSPLAVVFGALTSRHTSVVQIPDSAYCMSATAFLAEVAADELLKERVRLYGEYSFGAATQFAMCNGLHGVEERYARWILMADDRVGSSKFNLTQEYSAQMLGVRRASVTEVALTLSKVGLIAYRRGIMSVIDRDGLEEIACECYRSVNDDLQRLMGYGARQVFPIVR
jgi:CRP-like cAMP-binding protein